MTLTEETVVSTLRRTWQPVANSAALAPEGITSYTLLGVELVIARFASGQVLVADVACPHKGARLSQGCFRDGELMCPYHGWHFGTTGACLSIPSLLEPNPDKQTLAHLRTYATQERYGLIWVRLDNRPPASASADTPHVAAAGTTPAAAGRPPPVARSQRPG